MALTFFLSENPWTIDPKEMKGDRLQRFCLHLRPSDDPLGSWLPPGLGDDDLSNDFFQLCLWWTFGDWRFQRSLWSPDKFPSQGVFLHLASLAKPDLRRWTPSEPRNPPKAALLPHRLQATSRHNALWSPWGVSSRACNCRL